MSGESSETWRRRERSIVFALVFWSLWVSAMLAASPETLAEWAVTTDPLAVSGSILVTVALVAGLVRSLWAAYDWWAEPNASEGLTEVPWNE